MKNVIVLRGIPGSGKSTWAKQACADDETGGTVRINNDDIVGMLYGVNWRRQPGIGDVLKLTREQLLRAYLQSDLVQTIIIDNTNLATNTVRDLQKITLRFGAEFIVDDSFLAVPIATCIDRDMDRIWPVGADVINKMAKDAAKLKPWRYPNYKLPVIEPYLNWVDSSLPGVVVFDIDGTMAKIVHGRSPYDEDRILEDVPQEHTLAIYDAFKRSTTAIIFLTGRHEKCRKDTLIWLKTHVSGDIQSADLFMRATDDERPDYIVKHELFQEHIAGQYNIVCMFDDRDQVINLWRTHLKIPAAQMNYGDF